MKIGVFALIALAAGLPSAMAGEVWGTWEGTFTKGTDAFYAGFDLDVAGGKITGAGYVQGWGYSEVTVGSVEGDRFHFTLDRKSLGDGPISIEFTGAATGKSMAIAWNDGAAYQTTLHRVESQVTGPLSLDAAPKELEGKWTARFVGRIGDRPKMIGRIDFDFQVDGNKLTGMAHMQGWPGDCPISEGKVENGRFSFIASGRIPSSSGIPVLRFTGEIHGTQLKLTMRHQIFGDDNGRDLPLDASRR
jgi:hypothetical protein